ncbi:MAG: ROK family protein [Aquificae bacterium]|nr:ROK family protein [Aquificota bacterium]
MSNQTILGIDIGGTYIKYVVKQGDLISKGKLFIGDIKEKPDDLIEKFIQIIKKYSPKKVGIAVAGLYDKKEETLSQSPNLKSLEGIPLKQILEQKTKTDITIQNDASAAAYGEYRYGAGKGSKILVCLTLGTGLGGGLVIGGRLFTGISGTAMEIGHTTIDKDGWICHCGRKGCLESYVSSYGLERLFFIKTDRYKSSFEIIALANEGKKEAVEVMEEFSVYLAYGLMNLLHTLNPDKILLTGGIVENYPVIEKMAYSNLKKLAFSLPFRDVEIDLGKLGEFSGSFGALAIAEDSLIKNSKV